MVQIANRRRRIKDIFNVENYNFASSGSNSCFILAQEHQGVRKAQAMIAISKGYQ